MRQLNPRADQDWRETDPNLVSCPLIRGWRAGAGLVSPGVFHISSSLPPPWLPLDSRVEIRLGTSPADAPSGHENSKGCIKTHTRQVCPMPCALRELTRSVGTPLRPPRPDQSVRHGLRRAALGRGDSGCSFPPQGDALAHPQDLLHRTHPARLYCTMLESGCAGLKATNATTSSLGNFPKLSASPFPH